MDAKFLDQAVQHLHGKLANPGTPAEDEYYVEKYFFAAYFHGDVLKFNPTQDGEFYDEVDNISYPCKIIDISCESSIDGPLQENLRFIYYASKEKPSQKALVITEIEEENMLYWRSSSHDPKTEWYINSLAYDITNNDGDFIFNGEPVNL